MILRGQLQLRQLLVLNPYGGQELWFYALIAKQTEFHDLALQDLDKARTKSMLMMAHWISLRRPIIYLEKMNRRSGTKRPGLIEIARNRMHM